MIFRAVYTLLLYLATPFILLRLYWKGRKLPAYRQRLNERFSLGSITSSKVDVWIHAVSLGEVVAATPLIDALLKQDYRVLVTTMTPTGSHQVKSRFKEHVQHQYVPYDYPWALKRFFNAISARVGIIMETELWPNLISQARLSNMSLVMANARISDKAYWQYYLARCIFSSVLNQFDVILTQSELDASRFIAVGATSNRVRNLGNMKFDLQLTNYTYAIHEQLPTQWGISRPVFIAASTHDNEESLLLNEFHRLKIAIPDILLLIAPRHPERFEAVFDLAKTAGFKLGLRSNPSTITRENDVIILDCLGELLGFYQLSDYAFVGGSLVPIGGHNVLEPISMNVPVFCGPYINNSKSICNDLAMEKAIQITSNVTKLVDTIIQLHQLPELKKQQISNAAAFLKANQGSIERYVTVLRDFL